jgi:CubicO group peptidase (beta-lactamase class C family)
MARLESLTRRAAVQGLCAGGLAAAARARAQTRVAGISASEHAAMDAVAGAVMGKFDVPGLSVAIAHQGQLVYQQGFGFAELGAGLRDRQRGERMSPANLFRIASLSKPVTSVAIFTLAERGRLRLSDKVFGPGAILGTDYGAPPYKPFIADITVEHLLTHTAGGWQNDGSDPMFHHPKMDHRQLIAWTLANQPLRNPPGRSYAYSNFGYCVLGRVIEKLTGESYAAFVRGQILERCGVRDMRIAGNTLAQRAPNEVRYYAERGADPYGMNVSRMDSHGGWIASAPDLVRFLIHVDGFPTVPDILKPDTLRTMTTPSAASNNGYAKGWAVNRQNNWWHTGLLDGTTTLMVRTSSGLCWAALTNCSRATPKGLDSALDDMVWQMVGKVKAWHA